MTCLLFFCLFTSHRSDAVVTVANGYFGPRALTLRIGATAGVDTVQFDVMPAMRGNSLAFASPTSGNGAAVDASSGGVVFRMLMQMPLGTLPQPMTTTVTAPAFLACTGGNCAGYRIPFSSIRWTVAPSASGAHAANDLQSGSFQSGGGTQTLLNFSLTGSFLASGAVEVSSTMFFSYDNTTAYPAGHYAGTVTYTASLP